MKKHLFIKRKFIFRIMLGIVLLFVMQGFGNIIEGQEMKGITGITIGSVDLTIPPDPFLGNKVCHYTGGWLIQVAPRKVALICRRFLTGTWNIDFIDGGDLILFDDLAKISSDKAIPLTRNTRMPGDFTFIDKEFPIGGFIPFDAKLEDDSPHPFAVPPGQRQLFLDDYGVARIEHLTRILHQPEKKGAVIRPDRPWESALQTRSAPVWDPKDEVFKLWMITSTTIPGVGGMTYAESKDGIHWTKPGLSQMEVDGSLENNFVTMDPELGWFANAIMNVVYDPDDSDPARRYKGLGHCDDREPLISPDGIHWKRLDVPKIPSADESNLSYDRSTRTFIATVKLSCPYGRCVFLSTSKDFEHWTEPELIFHADDIDQELGREHIEARLADPALQQPIYNEPAKYKVDVYNMGVFRYEGLYVGMPAMFHTTGPVGDNSDGFHLVQLTCSRDLKTWKRLGDRKTFIDPSPVAEGVYDRTQILPPSRPVVHGDELWFYYTGIKYRAAPENPDPDGSAICLAVLRRDGFISLDAGEREGIVVTKPFKLPGTALYVNVDAGKGTLRVEVLNMNGKVLATSRTLTGDQLRGRIKWAQGELASFKEKVALRFTMRNAGFYSYWLE